MRLVVEASSQRRQPLVPHQHEIAHFRLVPRRRRIEAGRTVFDGVDAVARHRLPGREPRALQRLGRKALHRIAIDKANFGGTEHDREFIQSTVTCGQAERIIRASGGLMPTPGKVLDPCA